MSDVYRINKKLKNLLILKTKLIFLEKNQKQFIRLSRSFGIDFKNKNKNLLFKLSKKLIENQVCLIENNINKLKKI